MSTMSREDARRGRGRDLARRWRDHATQPSIPNVIDTAAPATRPLSATQGGVWMFEQIHPGTSVYTLAHAVQVRGPLDPARLDAALAALSRRHPALRSTVDADGADAMIRIERAEITAAWTDLREPGIDDATVLAEARAAAERVLATPFDLTHGPLARLLGFRLGDDNHLLVLAAHHLICDGGSLAVVLSELTELYAGADLPPVPPYAVIGTDPADLDYWRTRLAGLPPLELPFDQTPDTAVDVTASTVAIRLDAERVAALRAFAAEAGVTPFVVLLAAFEVTLALFSDQTDFGIGVPEAGRADPAARTAVALLANPLVLRANLTGTPTFLDLVGRVKHTFLDAYAHRHAIIDDVVAALGGQGTEAGTAVTQVTFAYHSALDYPPFPGTTMTPVPLQRTALADAIELHLRADGDAMAGNWDYRAEAFAPRTAERMAGYFTSVLAAALDAPDTSLSRLDLITAADRAFLDARCTTPPPAGAGECLHTMVARQSAATPDALAVTDGRTDLTYRDLDRRANRLARALLARGAGPERIVGVALPRSADLAVAVLGILKTGAAYLPLDPHYPAERLAFMQADSDVTTTVTAADLAELDAFDSAPVDAAVGPDNLAYVIYTSGSTGQPKGVLLTHRNAVDMVRWGIGNYSAEELRRVLASTSLSFDLSVFEFFVPLSAGGTVVVVSDALTLLDDPSGTTDDVTLVNTVPSAARELVAAHAMPDSVRVVNLAGEALPGALVDDLLAIDSVTAVHNLYGPSEDTTYSTGAEVHTGEAPPIGAPLPGERVYILDRGLRRVPVGGVGELYLAGTGLARGYQRRPGLTASRFMPDPFAAVAGERMYRTGDRARYRADGLLVYLGRSDAQVKVRGRRIELGEVEAQLHRHKAIQDAAVAVNDNVLVAYVVGDDGDDVDATDIRADLRAHLPEFMVPQIFVDLDALPLTPNGKVDRRALPVPETGGAGHGEPPRGDREILVADLWQEVLRVTDVGRDDNFFDLGGHSLLAGRVAARATENLGRRVPLSLLFERPTLADFAAALPADDEPGTDVAAPIPRLPRTAGVAEQAFPASDGQRRLWFLAELDADANAAYGSQAAIELTGSLDADVLQAALAVVIARHETLRTTFALDGDDVGQRVHADMPVFMEIDQAPAGERDEVIAAAAAADGGAFDLHGGPLLRARLIRFGTVDHVLLLTVHHLVSDGWSLAILGRDLSHAYAALRTGGEPDRTPLELQYADFAAAAADTPSSDDDLAFWRDALAGLTGLELPTDRPRPQRTGYRGARVRVHLDAALVAAVNRFATETGTTQHMVLLAAWEALLSRWCDQHDFGVGTVVAGRDRSDLEPLIGFFANTLVMRADVSGRPGFRTLLGRVRETALKAYAHQHVSFDRIVRAVAVDRATPTAPLFQTSFAYQNTPTAHLDLPDVSAATIDLPASHTIVDLGLSLWPGNDRISGWVQYATDLFEPATIERIVAYLPTLLTAALADPDTAIGALPVTGVLIDPPLDTVLDTPVNVVDAVEHWAIARFDTIAVTDGADTVTFAVLARRARLLGQWLRGRGVTADRVVALDMSRSPDLIAAILAIWQAGSAFLPLDCSIPDERRAYMIADTEAVLTLTDEVIRAARADIDAQPDERVDGGAHRNGLSHVMYTSGSTGAPKGVMAEHAQLDAFLAWAVPSYLDTGAGAPLQTPITFDLSFCALFGPLVSGDTMTLLPHEDPPIDALPAALRRGGFDFVKLTPAHLSLLGGLLPDNVADAARRLIVAGETLTHEHLAAWATLAPGATVVNEYGPTETVVGCFRHVFSADAQASGVVPIGRPAPGTYALILDRQGDPVLPGGVGELYIGGAQVARGYLHQPGLTARAFVPDPTAPGRRMYRSGDLVRELPDGAVMFLGRRDGQVKIRGYRIELGEIESALRAHAGIAEAAVTVAGDGAARMLAAYVVPAAGAHIDPDTLRTDLRRRLPEQMVPALYLPVASIPLTATGKIDRQGLPGADTASTSAAGAAPTARAAVGAVWQDLLHRPEIGDDDDFFRLGGHSLLATSVIARLRAGGYPSASLRMVFDHPTAGALAAALSAEDGQVAAASVVPAAARRPGPSGTRVADASPGQERIWLLSQLEDRTSAAYVIQGAIRLRGAISAELLGEALTTVVRRHETLRTTFRDDDGRIEQVIHAVPAVRLEIGDLPDPDGLAAIADSAARFDLAAGPLLRVQLLRVCDDEHVLLLSVHHIVADGISLAILADEIGRAYRDLADGREPDLGDLAVQYADIAAAQRADRQSPQRPAALQRWQDRLADVPPLTVHADRTRPARPSYQGAVTSAAIGAADAERVRTLAAEASATPFMVLLAVYLLLLARHAAQDDVTVGIPVAGRTRPEAERLIGFFMDTVVLRTVVAPSEGFTELIARVRETALDAFGDQDVPFEDVLRAVRADRDASRTPLFAVMFNYLNQPRPDMALPDVEVSPVTTPRMTAKVDLELYVQDTADGGLHLVLNYATDLFEAPAAKALLADYVRLLHALTLRPGEPVRDIRLAGSARPAAAAGLPAPTVVDGFAGQAEVTPERVAVHDKSGTVTYADLLTSVRRLGSDIAGQVSGRGTRIGVLCVPGRDVPTALLGIAAAGHTYVPLDPTAPAARLRELIALADVRALVADAPNRALAETVADAIAGAPAVLNTDAPDGDPRWSWDRPDPDAAAYTLFTSGSTGTPKGVVQSHGRLARHAYVYRDAVGITADDRVSMLATYTFDAAVLDLYAALLSGAASVPADLRADGTTAARATLAAARVTVYHSTPTVLRHLLADDAAPPWPAGLRVAVTGGEELRATDVHAARAALPPGCVLMNLYGATECTFAAMHVIDAGPVRSTVPIGTPADGIDLLLVDDDGRPADVHGELVCVGDAVACGYLDTDETARRFGTDGARPTYRTGDLAWRLADGTFEYAGRRDGQIKLRGQRVETGEIESRLRTLPDIADATVVARAAPDGETLLVAYVTGPVDVATVRRDLYATLPHHLVPSVVVAIAALPTTATGKIDKLRLPEPSWQQTGAGTPPATPTEKIVADVLGTVLGVADVGRDDDFFELGGHSLQATRVIGRLGEALGVDVPLRLLFERPTVVDLAAALADAAPAAAPAPILPSRRRGRLTPGRSDS